MLNLKQVKDGYVLNAEIEFKEKNMPMNKQTGNMYAFVSHTWNPIRGKCNHNCNYCYMKVLKSAWKYEAYLKEQELSTNLGSDNFIFVGSSTDMWGEWVKSEWIKKVLDYCRKFDNKYLFQSKNPKRFYEFTNDFPKKTVLGTTIETNRNVSKITDAPSIKERFQWMKKLSGQFETMVSIEPILKFDNGFGDAIKLLSPTFVSVGADSKGHDLPEPEAEEIEKLINQLQQFTIVKIKDNLQRLVKVECEGEDYG